MSEKSESYGPTIFFGNYVKEKESCGQKRRQLKLQKKDINVQRKKICKGKENRKERFWVKEYRKEKKKERQRKRSGRRRSRMI